MDINEELSILIEEQNKLYKILDNAPSYLVGTKKYKEYQKSEKYKQYKQMNNEYKLLKKCVSYLETERDKSNFKEYLNLEPDLINFSRKYYRNWSIDVYEANQLLNEAGYKEVNKNQYRRIKFNFNIKPSNGYFYEKKQGKIYQFFKEAEKVYINPEIALIVFRFKQKPTFNVLSINNITDTITEYELKTLDYLNKQHNLYYAIDTNKPIEYKGNPYPKLA